MQDDGNFVIYNVNGVAVWSQWWSWSSTAVNASQPKVHAASQAVVQDAIAYGRIFVGNPLARVTEVQTTSVII
jgi:hypothetical protein